MGELTRGPYRPLARLQLPRTLAQELSQALGVCQSCKNNKWTFTVCLLSKEKYDVFSSEEQNEVWFLEDDQALEGCSVPACYIVGLE